MPGGSVGRDQLAMAAKVRRHWFNPCRLGSRGHLGADFSLLLYTDLIKKRKPSRHITDEGELIRDHCVRFFETNVAQKCNVLVVPFHCMLLVSGPLVYSVAWRQAILSD